MKPLRYLLVAGLLSTVIAACSSNGKSSAADTTTTDTVAKGPKTEANPFRLRLDTIQVVTVERNPNDTANAQSVH
ncbi:ABC-type glycerol-3-phosphate transport system substrate-binding protein [Mucilaginibacter sp. UYNi724]